MGNRDTLLRAQSVVAGYQRKQVLHGVTVEVGHDEIVVVLGHNGAGKTTLLKAVFGLIPIWEGIISFRGEALRRVEPHRMLKSGVAYVPQGGRVFRDLTVCDNLLVAAQILMSRTASKESVEASFAQFPVLKNRSKRLASTLSGGEKQILSLAMALVTSPRLLLVDEPSLGLAPALFRSVLEHIQQITSTNHLSVLVVEQRARKVLEIAHRAYVLRNGIVSFSGPVAELRDVEKLHSAYSLRPDGGERTKAPHDL